jgi:hypothetical protein
LRETLIESLLVAEFRNKQAARLSRGRVKIRRSRSWPVASSTIGGLSRISPTRSIHEAAIPLHIAEVKDVSSPIAEAGSEAMNGGDGYRRYPQIEKPPEGGLLIR